MNRAQNAKRATLVAELAAQGLPRREIAEAIGASYQVVAAICRKTGIKPVHGGKKTSDARADRMAAMYSAGCTLAAIGKEFGLTRERVRQLLRKYSSVTACEGGSSISASRRKAARTRSRDQIYMERYGCTFDQWREVVALGREMMAEGSNYYRTPRGAFLSQRCNAMKRGIKWRLTFWDWWQFWLQSGKWEARGRGRGYCMCRIGDQGAYELGNVFIATGSDNVRDYQRRRKAAIRANHAAELAA